MFFAETDLRNVVTVAVFDRDPTILRKVFGYQDAHSLVIGVCSIDDRALVGWSVTNYEPTPAVASGV